ncbi:MAG: sulfite exporter TauE/SafE family protein [Rhodocyclaceae bacterium]|nr:sulfite exporter TauE/SafE family protein [Rhodocyclaceae bacterium]
MNFALAMTCGLMGLAGGAHCLGMCSAPCAGVVQAAGGTRRALWQFHVGRVAGYAALGALAAVSLQAVGWLGTQVAALRPFWTLLHVAALALGAVLLWRARQPPWLDGLARGAWARVRRAAAAHRWPWLIGALWALLPCSLLYSALVVAALAGNAAAGALCMAAFAAGSAVWLLGGTWLGLRSWAAARDGTAIGSRGELAVRLSGLALVAASAWALWHDTGAAFLAWCGVL